MHVSKKDVDELLNEQHRTIDDLANAVGYGNMTKGIYMMVYRVIEPIAELKQKTASFLKCDIDEINWETVPVSETSTTIPVVSDEDWHSASGYGLCDEHVRVVIVNDHIASDRIVLICKKCNVEMEHFLLGALEKPSSHLIGDLPGMLLGGPVRCGKCGRVSGAKFKVTPTYQPGKP